MTPMADLFQTADWKTEKHVPVIECPDKVKPGEMFSVKLTVGKEIAHPNTTEHHIRWVAAQFKPEGDKFSYELGRFEFSAHGESVEGPNTGPAYTHPEATFSFKTTRPGTIIAASYCNIHGLWQSSRQVKMG